MGDSKRFVVMVSPSDIVEKNRMMRVTAGGLDDLVAQLASQLDLPPPEGGSYELSVTEVGQSQPTFVQTFEQVPLKAKVQVWSPGTAQSRGVPTADPAPDAPTVATAALEASAATAAASPSYPARFTDPAPDAQAATAAAPPSYPANSGLGSPATTTTAPPAYPADPAPDAQPTTTAAPPSYPADPALGSPATTTAAPPSYPADPALGSPEATTAAPPSYPANLGLGSSATATAVPPSYPADPALGSPAAATAAPPSYPADPAPDTSGATTAAPPSFSSVVSPQSASAMRREPTEPPPQFASVVRPGDRSPPAFHSVKTVPAPDPEPRPESSPQPVQQQHQPPQGLPSYAAIQPSAASSPSSSRSSAGPSNSVSASDWRPRTSLPPYSGSAVPHPQTGPPKHPRPQQLQPWTPTLPEGQPPMAPQMAPQMHQHDPQQQYQQYQQQQQEQRGEIGTTSTSVPSYQPPHPYKPPQPTPPHSASLLNVTASNERTAETLSGAMPTAMGMEFTQKSSSSASSAMHLPLGAVPSPTPSSSGGDMRPGYERSWIELTAEQQAACRVLGYDRSRWDEERSELAASRMMAAEREAEEQRQAQEAADAVAAAAMPGHDLQSTASGASIGAAGDSPDLNDLEQIRRITTNGSNTADREDPFAQPSGQAQAQLSSVSSQVKIVDTELDEGSNKMFYVMDIERSAASAMQLPGGSQRVRKRYSEFEALRKELATHSKAVKALEFPKKQRIKGKRGGRKEKTVDARSSELETWLNNAIRVADSDANPIRLLPIIENWFAALPHSPDTRARASAGIGPGGSYPGVAGAEAAAQQEEVALAQEQAELMAAIEASNAIVQPQGQTVSAPSEIASPPTAQADEEAEMLRAIQMSLGQSTQPSQPPLQQPQLLQPASVGPEMQQPMTTTMHPPASASVNNLPTTLEAIEMGFPPEKVRRMQTEQQAATGSAYESTQELLEALMSMPD